MYILFGKSNKNKKDVNLSNKDTYNQSSSSEIEEKIIVVPEICTHCKSPNSKKIRLCEWCGNKIV
jgi:hypothetical protein